MGTGILYSYVKQPVFEVDLHLASRLRIRGAIPQFPYITMVWYLIKLRKKFAFTTHNYTVSDHGGKTDQLNAVCRTCTHLSRST
jgi:hypothetical protein